MSLRICFALSGLFLIFRESLKASSCPRQSSYVVYLVRSSSVVFRIGPRVFFVSCTMVLWLVWKQYGWS